MIIFSQYPYSEDQIKKRIQAIDMNAPEGEVFKDACRKLIGFIDLTSLEGTDDDRKIIEVCHKALQTGFRGLPTVAAVCFYPNFIKVAKKELAGSGIKVAAVAGAFPSGQTSRDIRMKEVQYAVDEGADEIDTVISRGRFLAGDHNYVFDELAEMKQICGRVHLKVILETGELQTPAHIRKASETALNAGADFIKTSTGKISPAATLDAFLIMADTVKEFHAKTGRKAGIKAAGGISVPDQAFSYLKLLTEITGEGWAQPGTFRIGASRLLDKLVSAL
ncbi:MAG: deoxyribose-phosphate aldolase [Bacteroidales bacterium]|nr:deoxyribose-phosphate aldolase [Bacteroidales bacterium]